MSYSYNIWGKTEELTLIRSFYVQSGNLAVIAEDKDGAPFATLTVNLSGKIPQPNLAYVDVNNCPWLPDFLEKNDIAYWTGIARSSGHCIYPLYRFKLDKLCERR